MRDSTSFPTKTGKNKKKQKQNKAANNPKSLSYDP
jgi:hypothetical protein